MIFCAKLIRQLDTRVELRVLSLGSPRLKEMETLR